MAETKPPLFHMHGMSALFHIPQQDPPKLKAGGSAWSQDFHDFLSQCLRKEPGERWTATKLLKHPFVNTMDDAQRKGVLVALIKRSKEVVKGAIDTSSLEAVIQEETEGAAEEKQEDSPGPSAAGADASEPGGAGASAAGDAAQGTGAESTPAKPKSDMAKKIARKREGEQLQMSRHRKNYNTIKLPSSRLRQQREAIAVSKTVMNEQMSALRKFQAKRADARKQLLKTQQQEMDAILKKQSEEALDLKRRHEVAWGTALREAQHEDDKLLRAQATARRRQEEVRAPAGCGAAGLPTRGPGSRLATPERSRCLAWGGCGSSDAVC